MSTDTIKRQNNEVIALHYDRDPQSVAADTVDRAADQIQKQQLLEDRTERLRVYDVGMGTGSFLHRLMERATDQIQPFGLDLSEKMIDCASQKIPELLGAVDTASNLEAHFLEHTFDLICTHFISGYVPLNVLAPKVWSRLEDGGYWSYLGATKGAFPNLQATANNKLLRWFFGAPKFDIDSILMCPRDQQEVFATLERHGFVVRQCETFKPRLFFRNFDEFLEFGYYGGWFTAFIDAVGLHKVSAVTRFLLNRLVFPLEDHHCIEIHLAQKVTR
ncbi:MAG TPA: class I SAM-dependent methyltransferase [Gemmataceae bacterium]|nr:class I SAM-dependent methyltransferase [Gemmataceae bacterium]